MTLNEWLNEYGDSHRHPTNIAIHKVCVPAIMFSVLGLLWCVPLPAALASLPFANLGTLFVLAGLVFYARLSLPMMLGMALLSGGFLLLLAGMQHAGLPILHISVAIFVVAWVGQFYGHKIEGKKPSFFRDLQFLLIGPAWTLSFLYRRLGIRY
ncbi:Mpo1 family 2-hydroxy fatty acid dioxygenase [Andreprevotia chitinilytica]|uniref:Mpo1 family 2-hydroxy fatty acid dioxygenase n=1 Tax=Andreprevotia chitinilytica TaxID=396808 RepID=UPI000550937A|nr:Mpo1-like protein [Andreprevotia chitinilytica]